MRQGVNKVILIGNLGKDPEIRRMSNGGAITSFGVATSESWKDRSTGQQQERTEWHRVVVYGKLAEIAGEYLKKGSQVYIEGQLQTRKWQDQQSGQEKYITEIVVQGFGGVMQMLNSSQQPQQPQQQPQQQQWEQPKQPEQNPDDPYGDGIPF